MLSVFLQDVCFASLLVISCFPSHFGASFFSLPHSDHVIIPSTRCPSLVPLSASECEWISLSALDKQLPFIHLASQHRTALILLKAPSHLHHPERFTPHAVSVANRWWRERKQLVALYKEEKQASRHSLARTAGRREVSQTAENRYRKEAWRTFLVS